MSTYPQRSVTVETPVAYDRDLATDTTPIAIGIGRADVDTLKRIATELSLYLHESNTNIVHRLADYLATGQTATAETHITTSGIDAGALADSLATDAVLTISIDGLDEDMAAHIAKGFTALFSKPAVQQRAAWLGQLLNEATADDPRSVVAIRRPATATQPDIEYHTPIDTALTNTD